MTSAHRPTWYVVAQSYVGLQEGVGDSDNPTVLGWAKALAALDFLSWGEALPGPALGAILVFRRPGGGHVGFYVGESDDAFYVLGGNQRDGVNYTWIEKARCCAIRWPQFVPKPPVEPIILTRYGAVSTNEA